MKILNSRTILLRLTLGLVGLLIVVGTPAHVSWLDIGSPGDGSYISGTHVAERNSVESYRWTAGPAEVRVPVAVPGEYDLELTLANVLDRPREAVLTCDGDRRPVDLDSGTGHVTKVLDCQSDGRDVAASVETELATVSDDSRLLGVSLTEARVTPGDRETSAAYVVLELLAVAAVLAGVWLAVCAAIGRRGEALVLVFALVWLLATVRRPELVVSLLPTVETALVLGAGVAAWTLRKNRRLPGATVAVLLGIGLLLIGPTPLVLRSTGLWSVVDTATVAILPWVPVVAIGLGSVVGGSRAFLLGVFAAAVSLIAQFAHVVVNVSGGWVNVTLSVPDWTSSGTAFSAMLVIGIGGLVALGALVAARSGLPAGWSMLLLVGATLSLLLGWRVQTMDFNGDEPHYYVMARSLGQDGDLELLDEYVDPEYQRATISPHGNIAVRRDFSANRYSALSPVEDDDWFLIPPVYDGWDGNSSGNMVRDTSQPVLRHAAGSRARLPALESGRELAALFPANCRPERLWVAATDSTLVDVTVSAHDERGDAVWRDEFTLDERGEVVERPLSVTCNEDSPLALRVEASAGDVVALAYDAASGFPFVGAFEADERTFAGLPRDRYASQDVQLAVLLHNPAPESDIARLTFLGPSERAVLVDEVPLAPGETVERRLSTLGASAVAITSASGDSRLVSAAVGTVSGAEYRLATAVEDRAWRVPIRAAEDADAGIWITFVNRNANRRAVALGTSNGGRQVTVCGGCARTELFTATDGDYVEVNAPPGFALAGVEYEERTGALHFDPGLPALAAPLARFGPPWAALLVPVIAGALLAAGMVVLLRDIGLSRGWLVVGACATLLAPMSPFSVRLYTEIVAAALIVWALVFWQRGRTDLRWNAAVVGVALFLPVLHGRLIPVALALLALAVLNVLERQSPRRFNPRQVAGAGGALAAVLLLALVVAELTVSPFSRDVVDYFQLRWVPTNVAGMLLDRGSGLLPVAPWVALAAAAPRPLSALHRAALLVILVIAMLVALRAGSWLTWGPPARYLLPAVPLILLFVMPAAAELWRQRGTRVLLGAIAGWSALATGVLHWVPLAGYVSVSRYLIDETMNAVFGVSPARIFPTVQPQFGGFGYQIIGAMVVGIVAAAALVQLWALLPPEWTMAGHRDEDAHGAED